MLRHAKLASYPRSFLGAKLAPVLSREGGSSHQESQFDMILWIESRSAAGISVLAFGFWYLVAAVIFIAASFAAPWRIAGGIKAITPVMLTPLSMIAGLLIAFLAAHVWSNADHANE